MTAQPPVREPLTGRQRAALDAIGAHVAEHGYPPSMRELGAELGLASPTSVWSLLQHLLAKGYLTQVPGRPRTIRIVR